MGMGNRFSLKGLSSMNRLPTAVVETPSLVGFKRFVDLALRDTV